MARIILITLFATWLLTAGTVAAQSIIAKFVFVTEPQTIVPGTSSDQITLEAQDSAGNPVKGYTICLEFTSSSITGDFSTNETWADPFKTLILTLGTNQYRRNLFYRDASAGTHTISVKALPRPEGKTCSGLSPEERSTQWTASQQITVSGAGNPSTPQLEQSSSAGQASSGTIDSSGTNSSSVVEKLPSFNYPSIKADAGENRTAVAGSLIEFKGNALGLNDKPLENARFWWNFGDGNSIEGRAILHTFRIPGIYTVGLHVSSGQYATSDYITVSVIPNQLQVVGVISGEDGYIRIANKGKSEMDIGGWMVEDSSGKIFTIPVKTKIAPQAEVAFLNPVTSLFSSAMFSAIIRYPNGREALRWSKMAVLPDNPVKHSVSNINTIPAQSDVKHSVSNNNPVTEEDEPRSNELASAASAGWETSWLFLALALVLSIAASIGFIVVKKFIT